MLCSSKLPSDLSVGSFRLFGRRPRPNSQVPFSLGDPHKESRPVVKEHRVFTHDSCVIGAVLGDRFWRPTWSWVKAIDCLLNCPKHNIYALGYGGAVSQGAETSSQFCDLNTAARWM
jgi:hypothetical protein